MSKNGLSSVIEIDSDQDNASPSEVPGMKNVGAVARASKRDRLLLESLHREDVTFIVMRFICDYIGWRREWTKVLRSFSLTVEGNIL